MSIQIESENLPAGIHNLFPTPLRYENVGTQLVTDQMITDTREELFKSMEFSNVGGYQSALLSEDYMATIISGCQGTTY